MNKENKKPKILLIEDDEFIVRAYKDSLEQENLEIVTALDGNEGLEKAKAENPDLILLDLILPNKNGFEVLKELKMNDQLRKIPVIILSFLGQKTDIQKGKELGAIDYLIKTDFSLKQVVDKVKFHLAKSKIKVKQDNDY
ncbi:response regulator transcription factor [Patescibacteria group bacterium]